MAYAPLGAAVALLPFLAVPTDIAVSAGLTALLYAWLRRAGAIAHLSAVTLGALTIFGLLRLASGNINIVIPALAVLGIVGGIALRLASPAAAWPGIRFFREDFLEFCALVGLLASFPAVMTFGVVGAADWVGRIAFYLAFVGAWMLLPMSATVHALRRIGPRHNRAGGAALTRPVSTYQ